jgi:hypothetical protein
VTETPDTSSRVYLIGPADRQPDQPALDSDRWDLALKILEGLGIAGSLTSHPGLDEARKQTPLRDDLPHKQLVTESDMNQFAAVNDYPGHVGGMAWNRVSRINDYYQRARLPKPLEYLASPEDVTHRRPASYLSLGTLAVLMPTIREAVDSKDHLKEPAYQAIRLSIGTRRDKERPIPDIVSFLEAFVPASLTDSYAPKNRPT